MRNVCCGRVTIDNAERDMLSFDAMECSSKCSRREFFAAAAAFGAVAPLLGVEGNARILPTGFVDEHLVAFLAGVGTGGNVNPGGTDGDILSRQIAAILKMRPLPGRCVILPESSWVSSSAVDDVFRKLAEAGIKTVVADKDSARIVSMKRCDLLLLDDSNGILASPVQKRLAAELPRWPRPLFVCAIHPPEWESHGARRSLNVCGMPFRELLGRVPRLAGYLYAHTHRWQNASSITAAGRLIPMLSLPSAEGWGDIGHVILHVDHDGAVAELRQDGFHLPDDMPHERFKTDWRAMVAANRGAMCRFDWQGWKS